jgi:phosphate/sulfate permease
VDPNWVANYIQLGMGIGTNFVGEKNIKKYDKNHIKLEKLVLVQVNNK